MKILGKTGTGNPALVYLAETGSGNYIEFVESIQPPYTRNEKWVLIVSTLFGCPVNCAICDAGGWYKGKLSAGEILGQIDYMISSRYPDKIIPARKFKVQFARMGDPALNTSVLDVLKSLPGKYNASGLMPCISTVAPKKCEEFFDGLIDVKDKFYPGGKFQMQFSIHTTDFSLRDRLIPTGKWDFAQIASYGERFYSTGDRKIALNFALAENSPVDADILADYFNPEIFLVKLTPVNPTVSSNDAGIINRLSESNEDDVAQLVQNLRDRFEVIVSVGELEENRIGSNCGQYVRSYMKNKQFLNKQDKFAAYEYKVMRL